MKQKKKGSRLLILRLLLVGKDYFYVPCAFYMFEIKDFMELNFYQKLYLLKTNKSCPFFHQIRAYEVKKTRNSPKQ